MASIFESIMGAVSRITQSRGGKQVSPRGYFKAEQNTGEQDAHLRFLGLSSVESIISSLVSWSTENIEEHEEEICDIANPIVLTGRNPIDAISMIHVLNF